MRFPFDVSNLNKWNKLFDLHRIAVQYYIEDTSDIHPGAVYHRKPSLLLNPYLGQLVVYKPQAMPSVYKQLVDLSWVQ